MASIDNYETQLKEEQKRLESEFSRGMAPVQLDFKATAEPGFAVDEILTILAFLVTSVTVGILEEVGKDVWVKMKEACQRIIRRQRKQPGHHTTEIRVAVQQTAGGVTLLYVLRTETNSVGEDVKTEIETFWEALPDEVSADFSVVPSTARVKEFKVDAPSHRVTWVKHERWGA